jgi:internalin A
MRLKKEAPMNGPQIFISYSHEDEKWLKELDKFLKPIERQFPTAVWSDRQIGAGARWATEIEQALASAKLVMLLVSPSFLASDFIHQNELGPILAAAGEGRKKILWVLLSACPWKETALKDIQAAHDIARPLDQLSRPKRNSQLTIIADTDRKSLEQLT